MTVSIEKEVKPCKYCASDIPSQAIICASCKSYQSSSRNWLVFIVSAAGLLALLGSMFVFVVGQWSNFRKNVGWKDDVDVLFFQTYSWPKFGLVVTNKGDGPVYVAEILIKYSGGNSVYRVNADLAVNGTFNKNTDIWQSEEYSGYLATKNGAVSNNIRNNSDYYIEKSPCFFLVYLAEADSDIARMNSYYAAYGLKLASEQVDAIVSFYSLHFGKMIYKQIPMVAAFQPRKTKPCER